MPRPISQKVQAAARCVLGEDYELAGAARDIRSAAARYERTLSKIEGCRAGRSLRGRLYWLLRARSTWTVAVLLAAQRRRLKLTWGEFQSLAEVLFSRRDCGEIVDHFAKKKSDGGVRMINVFRVRRTAQQVVGLHILRAICPVPESEMARRGMGRNQAVRNLISEMGVTGNRHLLIADVRNFFGSITPEMTARVVPLPISVIEVLFFVNMTKENHDTHTSPLKEIEGDPQPVLPTGSLASPHIASLILAMLLRDQPGGSAPRSYVDDIAQSAGSATEAEANKEALISRASAHPAGPLEFKRLECVELVASNSIDYLGYRLSACYKGGIRVQPTPMAIDGFLLKLARALRSLQSAQLYETAEQRTQDWIDVQAAWSPDEMEASLLFVRANDVAQLEKLRRAYLATAKAKHHPKVGKKKGASTLLAA